MTKEKKPESNNINLPEFKSDRWIKYHITDEDDNTQSVEMKIEGYGIVPLDEDSMERDTNRLRKSRMIIESITSFVTFMKSINVDKEYYLKVISKVEEEYENENKVKENGSK